MSLRPLLPTFKQKGNVFSVNKKGRMMIEIIPRNEGGIAWDGSTFIILGLSELGAILTSMREVTAIDFSKTTAEGEQRALHVKPLEKGGMKFMISGDNSMDQEMASEVSPAEIEVLKSIISTSLSQLSGWDTLMHLACQKMVTGAPQINDIESKPFQFE